MMMMEKGMEDAIDNAINIATEIAAKYRNIINIIKKKII